MFFAAIATKAVIPLLAVTAALILASLFLADAAAAVESLLAPWETGTGLGGNVGTIPAQ